MRRSAATLVLVTLALVGICSAHASAQALAGRIQGTVTDDSSGVLPGVAVVATSRDGRVIETAVTDAGGGYTFVALPAGAVRLAFQLDGFSTTVIEVDVQAGGELQVVERLKVAPITETVVVVGNATVDASSALFKFIAPPPPVLLPVPIHDPESICGPAKPSAVAESLGTIRSGSAEAERRLYTKDDQLVIEGGTANGLDVGRNLVARRYYRVSGVWPGAVVTGEHTSGLLQIVAADERTSKAVVVYACDELMQGDFLASFSPEPVRQPDPVAGIPEFDDAARILFADAGQMLGVPRRLMVIDRGSSKGLRVGQRLTLFRPRSRGVGPRAILGDAIVVAIRADSATIRVERATDMIMFGDWAAPQSLPAIASR
jgi:hypothetical protein